MNPLQRSREIRRLVIQQSKRAHVGHIGSALSIVDLLVCTYDSLSLFAESEAKAVDKFILSKGHAALALYALFHSHQKLSLATLNTFCENGTLLGVHPEHRLPGIEFSTGSLGHGLSYACGLAYAQQLRSSASRTVVLLSDAECNEGSVWEAALFAAQHKLTNIIAVVDYNQQQALGAASQILNLFPLTDKWAAFGWNVICVDGHDHSALQEAFNTKSDGRPRVIVANTVFGKGISFMERQLRWHYMPLSDAEYQTALCELESEVEVSS